MAVITKQQLNVVVRALAAKDRPAAVEILARFGVENTVKLKPEHIAEAHAAFEEALKKFDASTP